MTYEDVAQLTGEEFARLTEKERQQHIAVVRQRLTELEQERQRIEQWHAQERAKIMANVRAARAGLLSYGLPVPVDTA